MIAEEPILRPLVFIGLVALFAIAEAFSPKRQRSYTRLSRWWGNFGVLVIGAVIARVLLPVAPVGAALWAAEKDLGVLALISAPALLEGLAAFLLLDLLIYFQHRIFHGVPILWRIHRMHHTDLDFDVSTGIRFHPIEILLSLIIKIAAVIALGVSPVVVIVFEVVLNGTSLFNHANLALPERVDRVLRLFVVTPDMHRVHHSVLERETNSNFGFNLPWWDRLFGTYRSQPAQGHDGMTIGLPVFRDQRAIALTPLLLQPFVSPETSDLDAIGNGDQKSKPK